MRRLRACQTEMQVFPGWGVSTFISIGSLRNDDGYGHGNDNATNQCFDWLNEEKLSCCTCSTLFGEIFVVVCQMTT